MLNYAELLGTEPGEVARAETYEAVQNVVREANTANNSVIPWGGGTAQTYGYAPERADVLLDLSGMNRILAHEPGDLTVTVEAGATLEAVQNRLAEKNQFLPLDAANAQAATIGGIIAANAWGPGRTGYGSVRDFLLGLTVVDAQGRIIKGGGKVVKNVTGYDTPKLHIGALGTLGVVVEATFKVAPRPETASSLFFALPTDTGADKNTSDFTARLLRDTAPMFAVLQNENKSRIFAVLFAGYKPVVESEAERAAKIAQNFGVEMLPALPPGLSHPFADAHEPGDAALIGQFAGRPAQTVSVHSTLADRFTQTAACRVVSHPAAGFTTLWFGENANDDAESAARQMIQWGQETQTPLAFLHAPLSVRDRKAGVSLWSPLPPALPLMQTLKQILDPKNTLNPGRFVV